ncbi:aminodeoxychorismate lyase [Campylobacterota bacterium]|nr:aminodeoxychorismate lyase [Campylobacterota bacterium]
MQVESGALRPIVTHLKASGIDLNELDIWLIRCFGVAKSGVIDFETANGTRLDFYLALITGKSAFDEIRLIPGETTVFVLRQIASQLGLDPLLLAEIYNARAPYPEGVLIPDTYQIVKNADEKTVIRSLLERSMKVHKERSNAHFGHYDETEWFRVITIASVIQKEAAGVGEMPLVSSVIVNRLKKNMRLQMDGTLNYGEFSHQRVTPERIKTDTSLFNTYKRRGLPPYPVALASPQAIDAALNPAETDYLFFVRGRDGQHDFSSTYKTHLFNIRSGDKP